MFFVYKGYVDADNYDASEGPIYTLTECKTVQEVIELKRQFVAETVDRDDIGNPIFRVIEGKERHVVPKEVVVTYDIK